MQVANAVAIWEEDDCIYSLRTMEAGGIAPVSMSWKLALNCHHEGDAILGVRRASLKKDGVGSLAGEVRLEWIVDIPCLVGEIRIEEIVGGALGGLCCSTKT